MSADAAMMAPAWPAPELAAFAPPIVELAARAWPLRAAEEDRSEAVFQEIHTLAEALELGGELLERISGAVQDEGFHRELCERTGARLGAPAARRDRLAVHRRLAALPSAPRARLLSLLAIEVAAGETVSCNLFRVATQDAREPLTRWALTSILRDEARHAQLGWDGVRRVVEQGVTEEELAAVRADLRRAFASMEQTTAVPALRRLERDEPFEPALAALGVLHPEVRVRAFYEAIERRVLPRLDELGLAGTSAWADRYRA
jgi:hypothetical protein